MTDWQKGDLALCVKVGPWERMHSGRPVPARVNGGEVHQVSRVGAFVGVTILYFDDVLEPDRGFDASRFRKVTPPKPTADDREVIALMKGKKAPA